VIAPVADGVHQRRFASLMTRTKFGKGDAHYREWEAERKGIYTTNGGVLADE